MEDLEHLDRLKENVHFKELVIRHLSRPEYELKQPILSELGNLKLTDFLRHLLIVLSLHLVLYHLVEVAEIHLKVQVGVQYLRRSIILR